MGRRRSPHSVNTKRPKNKGKYNSITASDERSQHAFYRTQSKGPEQGYDYFDQLINHEDFYTSDFEDSRIFGRYDSKRRGSGESNVFYDYTTSAVSNNSLKKKRKDPDFSGITASDNVSSSARHPEKYDEVSSDFDYEYSNRNNTRYKQHKQLMHDESEHDRRKYKSTSKYFEDLTHEEPEREFDFENYFEKTNSRVVNSSKQKRRENNFDTRKKQNLIYSKIPNKEQGYQVYAYHEPKHNRVFRSKRVPEDMSFTSEVEIKTHEYPILAFRDKNTGKKRSDMIYLPVIVLDKKSGKPKLERIIEQPINLTKKEDFQVFAANLQDQNNIFQNFSNVTTSKVPVSQETNNSAKTNFETKITSGVGQAGSLLGSIIDEALINQTKADQKLSFKEGKTPFTYQVGVDLLPIGNTNYNGEESSLVKNKSITDPVNNDYPVSKDYIKVSVSEQQRKSKEESESSQAFQVINDNKIATSIAESRASKVKKSIMRTPSQVGQEVKTIDRQTSNMTLTNTAGQGYKIAGRASRVESGNGGDIKEKLSKTSIVNERASQRFNRQSGSHKPGSIFGSKAATSGLFETARESETRLTLQASNRNSMKSEKHNETRSSKVPTIKTTPPSQIVHDQQTVISTQPSMDRMTTLAQFAETSPIARNPSESPAEGRKSAAIHRTHSEANMIKDDSRKLKTDLFPGTRTKSIVGSSSKKSLVPGSAHQDSKEKRIWPLKIEEDNSEEAIRTFAKEIFQTDFEPKKKSTLKSVPHTSIASKGKPTLAESPVSEHQLRLSHSKRLPSNDRKKSEITNDENKAVTNNAPKEEKEKKMQRSLSRTSRILTVLSKLGKKKSSEKLKSYIPTSSPTGSTKSEGKTYPEPDSQEMGDSQFVRSIEPTVTQYKKENNKTQSLKKSKSKQDIKPPEEQKSLTRLFSRSKTKLNKESNYRTKEKKKKKHKSRSFLGILKRSKSSNKLVSPTPKESEQTLPPDEIEIKQQQYVQQECECFVKYTRTTRECAYFFLGVTLHEQIMNVLDALVGVKTK